MKLSKAGEICSFLSSPPPTVAAVLVYGPDAGLVHERADALGRRIAGPGSDPFRVSELAGTDLREDPARLVDEALSLSLAGGRRVVRVRAAADSHAPAFEGLFEAIEGRKAADVAFVVVEAGELGARSGLRTLFEGEAMAAAMPCYLDDPGEIESLVRGTLKAKGVAIESDALAYLVDRLGEDRAASRSEIEKLALYAEGMERVALADVRAAVGDGGVAGFDDANLAAATGDARELDRALALLYEEGTAPVAVLRVAQKFFQRLHLAAGKVAGGMDAESALKSLRPPVYWKDMPQWRAALKAWTPERLAGALDVLLAAEADCKTTGLPAAPIAARALLSIASAARRGRR